MTNIHFRMLGLLIAGAGLLSVLSAATQTCYKHAGQAQHEPTIGRAAPTSSVKPSLANIAPELQCEVDPRKEMSCLYLANLHDISRDLPGFVANPEHGDSVATA